MNIFRREQQELTRVTVATADANDITISVEESKNKIVFMIDPNYKADGGHNTPNYFINKVYISGKEISNLADLPSLFEKQTIRGGFNFNHKKFVESITTAFSQELAATAAGDARAAAGEAQTAAVDADKRTAAQRAGAGARAAGAAARRAGAAEEVATAAEVAAGAAEAAAGAAEAEVAVTTAEVAARAAEEAAKAAEEAAQKAARESNALGTVAVAPAAAPAPPPLGAGTGGNAHSTSPKLQKRRRTIHTIKKHRPHVN